MASDASSLPVLLANRARNASDSRLALDAGGGLVVAATLLVWRPAWWILPVCAALCFAAFGMWGIADRELLEPKGANASRDRLLSVLRTFAAAMGSLAALVLIFGVLGLLLGTIVS